LTLDKKLDFCEHISLTCRKAAWQLSALRRISKYLTVESRMIIFKSYVVSNLNYCKVVWHFCLKKSAKKLERLQERGLRIVYDDYTASYDDLLMRAKIKRLADDRLQSLMIEVFKARKGFSPGYIIDMFE
jgi:hypothetical protein